MYPSRKYSVGDGFKDFAVGCVAGVLFEFGGWAAGGLLRGVASALADRAATMEILEITARVQAYVDRAVEDYAAGKLALTPRQAAAASKGLGAANRGDVIHEAVFQAIDDDAFLRARVTTTPRYTYGPDVILRRGNWWWDITTPKQWAAHLKYIPTHGRGIPILYR